MPATRITLAQNKNQTQKTPLLVPGSAVTDPDSPNSIRALVFKAAQTKLRIKKPSKIYVARTGQELCTSSDWENVLRDDIVLLVSAGEDYVGIKREEGSCHDQANPSCPIALLASSTPIDKQSIAQLETTARTLPGIVHAVGQPDLHPGTKFPIGAVFVSKGWIHPPLIGGDIGCGMAWYKTTLSRRQVDGDKGKKVAEKLRGLEGPWRTQQEREIWMESGKEGKGCSAGEEWDLSLGTIGAGNHFAELQVVEKSSTSGVCEDEVVLLVHSGSRGYGGSILKKFTNGSKTSFEEGSLEALEYLAEHNRACEWAKANRDLIALRFLSCLEPGTDDWALGASSYPEMNEVDVATITHARRAIEQRKVVDIWHNNVEKTLWPPFPPSSTSQPGAEGLQQEQVWMHRKGAAPTCDPTTSQPLSILPLPGSRGTPTLILKPTFSDSTSWGLKNGLSLAHGAGRAMSRAKALSTLASKYKGQNLLEPRGGDHDGTWVICDEKDLVWEEAPEAYKDVELVGQDLVNAGAAEIVGSCRARVSYKVRNEAR